MKLPDNIFAGITAGHCGEEHITAILERPGIRIERIVSTGQASPPSFWYDQPFDEWVMVLAGAALLRFESEPEARQLAAGDYVFIPAHARHRVDWTSPDKPTVWLAVHIESETSKAENQRRA